jgi:Rv2525c-like, glycoside hydrolase-like domain
MRRWTAAIAVAIALVGIVACQPTKSPPPSVGGSGFDACTAPSTGAMSAWLQSPYRFVGVYIGGGNAACSQPNLTSSWVNTVHSWGYRLIPTYVGLQAWCTSASGVATMSGDLATAQSQGYGSAVDAVQNGATPRGLGPGTPIYFDMEAYNSSAPGCTDAVAAFMSGWIAGLHNSGYTAAMYSSAASGVRDMAQIQGNPPYTLDAIWFAHWNGDPSLYDAQYFSDSLWPNARIHQFQGGHNETWGGVTINMDSDSVGGPTG